MNYCCFMDNFIYGFSVFCVDVGIRYIFFKLLLLLFFKSIFYIRSCIFLFDYYNNNFKLFLYILIVLLINICKIDIYLKLKKNNN